MGRNKLPPPDSFARCKRDQQRDQPIADYVLTRASQESKRGALERAIEAAAEHFHCDRTTVQRALQRYRAAAPLRQIERTAETLLAPATRLQRALVPGKRVARAVDLIVSHLTATEFEELGSVSFTTLLQIALDRRAARRVPHPSEKVSGKK